MLMIGSKCITVFIDYSLVEGNPQKVLRVLHHLLFGVSKKFTDKFLKERCGVNLDIQFMSDGKFYRHICLILVRNIHMKVLERYIWIQSVSFTGLILPRRFLRAKNDPYPRRVWLFEGSKEPHAYFGVSSQLRRRTALCLRHPIAPLWSHQSQNRGSN